MGPLLLALLLEIQTISVSWNVQVCGVTCANLLDKSLSGIPGVAEIEINTSQGRAVLHWAPNMSFSYESIKRAFQRVGVAFNPFEMRVRGTLSSRGKEIYLTSIGDNTRFTLIGPAPRSNSQYISRGSLVVHQLTGDLLDQLKQAEQSGRLVEIAGELYMAETPPYRLLVNRLTVPNRS